MIKTITIICFVVFIFLYIAEMKISFNPFSIQFDAMNRALGILFLIISFFYLRDYYYTKGYKDTIQKIEEIKKQEIEKLKQ